MKRMIQASIVCFILCLPTFIRAVPVSSLDEAHNVEIQLLSEISNPRQKRSASDSNLPDHLVFKVPVAGEDVVLRLKQSKLLPTFTSEGKLATLSDDSAVYTDMSRDSAMIVKRSSDEYKLSGIFSHASQEWNLEPLSRDTRSTKSHQLFPQRAAPGQVISFAGDEYYDMEERPELIPSNKTRTKRAVTQHVVELAFVVDFEDLSKWRSLVGSADALSEMRLWYTYVSESINIRYASIQDSSIAINTRTTFLRILTDPSEATFISNLISNGQFSGSAGLTAFRNWIISEGSAIPSSDHYMLFTGYDITGATGVAFSSRVCTASGVSISENTFQGTLGGIAAHELGHSLSAEHDDDDGCSDADEFVMAAVLRTPVGSANAGNPWKFSSCSISSFSSYLNGVSCTLPENTSGNEELPPPVEGQRAGDVLSRDEQCVRSFQDSASFFCESLQIQQGGLDQLCRAMYCSIPNGGGFCQTTLPQEFTPCGTDKWCVRGLCVDVTVETTTTTTTPEPTTTTTTTTTTTSTTTTTTTPEPTTTTTTTPAPTTTTTTTPEPTTTTTTTTTTPEPTTTTTTTTTPEPTTTTTTTTPEPTTTTTTTTTTPAPTTTTTTTTTPEPTTTTTTTPEPTTTTTTTTTTTPEPTTTTTTTTTTPKPTTTTTTPQPTTTTTTTTTAPEPTTTTSATTTTSEPTTSTSVTTRVPTTTMSSTTTTSTPVPPITTTTTTTTTRRPGPTSISDCIVYLYRRDWRSWWLCVRYVVYNQQRQQQEKERRREREEERRDNQSDRRPGPKPRGNPRG